MALKPITLRLDEDEYEKLKEYLSAFGDPDITIAYVIRSYIRDLNRALPFLVKSGWDLKNYFGLLGSWLKQIGSSSYYDMFSKLMVNPWAPGSPHGKSAEEDMEKGNSSGEEKRKDKEK